MIKVFCVFVWLCLASVSAAADMMISGGTIYTMNPHDPTVEAVYVKGERIVFAGGELATRRFTTSKTRFVDLKGSTMTPGFIEGHGHLLSLGFSQLNLDLNHAKTFEDIVDQVAEAAAASEKGE